MLNKAFKLSEYFKEEIMEYFNSVKENCNHFDCRKKAKLNKKYCDGHMIYCQYCGSDEVSIQLNGYAVCIDWRCSDSVKNKEQPKYTSFGQKYRKNG